MQPFKLNLVIAFSLSLNILGITIPIFPTNTLISTYALAQSSQDKVEEANRLYGKVQKDVLENLSLIHI